MIHFKSLRSRILSLIGSLVIIIIISSSTINYTAVRRTLIKDVRENQLLSFTEASQSDIQMVIEKAIETSILLSEDPLIVKWFKEGEADHELGKIAKDKLTNVSESMGYFTVFAINAITNNYWAQNNKLIDVMSESDEGDGWFYGFLKEGKKITLNFDYNPEMDQTLFFFNALIGSVSEPIGTAGVGINPDKMIEEFKNKKLTKNSRLWLINQSGEVQISAFPEEIGQNISAILPTELPSKLLNGSDKQVIPDISWEGQTFEFAKMKIGTTDFLIITAAPTTELISILDPIRTNSFILGVVFFILTVLIVYVLAGSIANPLKRITGIAQEFSIGNLTFQIDTDLLNRRDEIGSLSAAFKEMKIQISRIVLQVKKSTITVYEGSNVLTSSSQDLSSSATQQAAATEEVSASMEQMGANIGQNASNAKQTESIMDQASKDTENGGAIVNQTVEAIKNINENVRVIQDIAMQTNILALNAAVEAARAGEHGKGFAVVASEVRKLAEKSRTSAVEINELATSSVEVAEKAGSIFTDLVPVIQNSFNLVREISAASNEQDIGANQVNKAISELDKVSQDNASAADNISNLTQEFVNEVRQLQDAISFFKVDE